MSEELSADEAWILISSRVWGFGMVVGYYGSLARVAMLGYPRRQRLPLWLAPPLGLIITLGVLLRFAARDVRSNAAYIFLFMTLGALWGMVAVRFFSWLGISSGAVALASW